MVDFQKIIKDVKSMISPMQIPEVSKDDPVGYCVSEMGKIAKDLTESISKLNSTLGALAQALAASKVAPAAAAPVAPVAPAPVAPVAPAAKEETKA